MTQNNEIEKVLTIASGYFAFSPEDVSKDSAVLILHDRDKLDLSTFRKFSNEIENIGFTAFTGNEYSYRVYVGRKSTAPKRTLFSKKIKLILFFLSILTVFYAGYSYQVSFSGQSNVVYDISYIFVFFVSPIFSILLLREVGRYIAFKTEGMHYSLPILIPDPVGLGTMGSVISQSQPFISKRSMLKAGLYPLILGFTGSTMFLIVGIFLLPASSHLMIPVNSPVTKLSLPLIFSLIFFRFAPETVALNLLSYAGWVGIVINAFNAFPLGYLDGGLIFSSLEPDYSKIASYLSIVVIAGLSFIYPSWFIILVFAIILGIQGPAPLYALRSLSRKSRLAIVLSIFFVVAGMAPIPVHIVPTNFDMHMNQNTFLITNGSRENMTLNLSLTDISSSIIVPAFNINPSIPFTVFSTSPSISPGKTSRFLLSLGTYSMSSTGIHNFTISAYSGTSVIKCTFRVLEINSSTELSFSNSNPLLMNGKPGLPINITFLYSSIGEKNITLYSIAPNNFSYTIRLENLTLAYTGSAEILSKSFIAASGVPIFISLLSYEKVKDWELVAIVHNFDGAVAILTLS